MGLNNYYLDAGGGGTYRPTEQIRNLIGCEGGLHVHAELMYGWSNMPEVFTFRATSDDSEAIEDRLLAENLGFLPLVKWRDW